MIEKEQIDSWPRQVTYEESDRIQPLPGYANLRVSSDGTVAGTTIGVLGDNREWISLGGCVRMSIDAPVEGQRRTVTLVIVEPITNINGALVVDTKDAS